MPETTILKDLLQFLLGKSLTWLQYRLTDREGVGRSGTEGGGQLGCLDFWAMPDDKRTLL